jgi:hypothetical protein
MISNIDRYKAHLPDFVYREKMKAGITGFAQIEGRYNTTPEDKLMLDLMYIESFSIWLDVKLLMRTATVIFRPDSAQGFVTPPADTPGAGQTSRRRRRSKPAHASTQGFPESTESVPAAIETLATKKKEDSR